MMKYNECEHTAKYKLTYQLSKGITLSCEAVVTYKEKEYSKIELENEIKKDWAAELTKANLTHPVNANDIKIKCVSTTDDRPRKPTVYTGMCAYIVELEDENLIKVGMSCSYNRRKKELEKEHGTVNTIHLFKFDDIEDAYMMEVLLHRFFKQYYPNSTFIPNDRFENADYTLAELQMLDKVAEELRNKKWF